ncbi:splicing factor 3B subunit 3 [Histomonas meleagridis]|uniref:splicing factor 3B subunit 3 n=1 Tax=Histomonas meleagridis TaxID=135588 RepID=UPI003559CDD4|nr:splicing factor 3B subunit 3 [Histomonas meleagridis]KAH0803302.1 splicing factor 3B subunit 3 [Histomonas meleagridis]
MLTISSSRGGIGTIDFSGKDPLFMYTEKPTNCCHQCFPMSSGFICRLEGDSKIIHYTQYPGTPIHVNTSSDFEITHFFEFQNEIILCGKGVLVMPNGDFINLPNTMDTIIDHTLMTDSIILLLTSSGLLLQFNDCYDLTTIETHPKSTNIYHLSDELFLIRYPSRYCIGSINDHTVSTRFTTSNGIKMLKYGSQIGYISPYFITSSNNNLILLKQGSTVGTISTTTISDPIYGIHVFEYELRHFVAISHHSSTRLLEITGKQIQMSNAVKLKENSTTLGIAVLKTKSNSQAVIQIAPESIIFCSSTKNKEYTLQAQNAQTVAFAHNSKQILIAYSNRTVFLIETQKGNGNDIDKTSFEQAFSISTMALSKSDPLYGNAEMVAYGGTDQKNQFILIQMVSFDQAARTKVLTELMPWNVVSLEFLNETLLCIGLGNGAIVIGNVNQAQRHLEKVVSIQIGSGPCFLSKMFYKNAPCVFALNSRPCVIHAPKGIPLISPLSMTSVSFAAPAPIDGHFLSVTGQNLSVNVLSDINNEFSNTVFPMESEIVTFTPMHRERFIIIASSNALYVMDPIKNNARNLNEYFKRIDYFENETVISIDVSNPSQVDKPTPQAYLSVVTRTPDNQSILRLYTFNINSISTQIHTPIIGNYCQPINACCCVVIGNTPHIIACSDESVLDFKSSNRLIRLVVQIDQVGNEMSEIFYSHHIDNEYYFFIGDKKRSVKLVELNNELKQFNIIAEEGFPRRISTISKYGDTSVSGTV